MKRIRLQITNRSVDRCHRPLSILLSFFFFMLILFTNRRRCTGNYALAYGTFWWRFWSCICYFLVFLHPIMLFLGGVNFKKCFQQAITLLYSRFRRSQQCCVQRMCVQQYVCLYAKYSTLCVHTAVRPRNIPRNINRMTAGLFLFNV